MQERIEKMKKIILGFILGGIVFTLVGVVASTMISSKNVTYQNKTVNNALDELYSEAVTGKELVAAAISNKGITTTSNDTYETMANNINSIEANNNLEFKIRTQGYGSIITLEVSNYHYMKVENSSSFELFYRKDVDSVTSKPTGSINKNTTKIVDISDYETIMISLTGPGGSSINGFAIVSFYN